MDQSSIPSEIEEADTSQMQCTADEVRNTSTGAYKFISVEESQAEVTFDVSSSMMDTSVEDKTLGNSQSEGAAMEKTVNGAMAPVAGPSSAMNEFELEALDDLTVENDDEEEALETLFFHDNLMELGRYLWRTTADKQCFTKGCLWSPDGTCCLVPVNMDGMHLVELPSDLYDGKLTPGRQLSKLSTAVHVKEGGTVYDVAWYPFMNSEKPETCCWIASRQHEPIQMWDAFNGDLRATYRGYDEVDEIEAAISVTFSCDGQHVLGGYKKCIRIFNTDTPGRKSTKLTTKQPISCFALTPNTSDIITTGSWNGLINLYDQRVPDIGSLSTLSGHTGGITHLKYSMSGKMLFSGARKDNSLCLWDMRNFSEPVEIMEREVTTNQRVYFDLSPNNEWLISGDTSGLARAWNLRIEEDVRTFQIHGDSCNGVSFHPNKPIIASSSGQYHFVDIDKNNPEDKVVNYENSLIFWWIEKRDTK